MARAAKKSAAKKSGKSATGAAGKAAPEARGYVHATTDMAARPEIGVAPRLRSKAPPARYRYDSSLSPALDWDTAPARDAGAFLLSCVEEAAALPPPQRFPAPRVLKGADGEPLLTIAGLQDALAALKRMQRPFLDWAGKAERATFDVPTMPLFVHERLSTAAIVETFKAHEKKAAQSNFLDLFADPRRPLAEQVRSYEHQGRDPWVNRLILGDSLVVMNSLLKLDGLGGQVQMIFMDPPYGVKFGSNFQPFVRKRDVSESDDADLTREPEMVQAYRDTWELGVHSYLTYLRDRLSLARDLLGPTGSIFVQIGDDNLHRVRDILDEVFGTENFIVTIPFKKKGNQRGELLDPINDYLLWFARDKSQLRQKGIHQLFEPVPVDREALETFSMVEMTDGTALSVAELSKREGVDYSLTPEKIATDFPGARLFASQELTNEGFRKNQSHIFSWNGRDWDPGLQRGKCWKHTAITEDGSPSGMQRIADAQRLYAGKNQLRYRRYLSDFGYREMSNWWDSVGGAKDRMYVVQTNSEIIKRCLLMTTNPGDLVFDPTCGGGTTAFVAEQWGRRWITCDTSRVPLVLTRQRLLTANFHWYRLKDEPTGPGGGFVYARRQNRKGQETGGIVPHITSSTIANGDAPVEEVLVDRPEDDGNITRVTGPFVVEATLPTPQQVEAPSANVEDISPSTPIDEPGDHIARMIEVLRRAPTLALPGNRKITLRNIRRPGRTLSLSAEALVDQEPAPFRSPEPKGATLRRLPWSPSCSGRPTVPLRVKLCSTRPRKPTSKVIAISL